MDLLLQNLISPVVLAFVLGVVAHLVKSDLEIPPPLYQGLSIYLLFAIGLKGGVALAETPLQDLAGPVLATLLLGAITPLLAFFFLETVGRIDRINAAAAAAHYGSVSVIAFLAAIEAAKLAGLVTDGFLPALVAILEIPGIIVGLLLARQNHESGLRAAVGEVLAGKSVLLLAGGMAIGAMCGAEKMSSVAPFFVDPFKGILCLFLLELGVAAGRRVGDASKAGWRLLLAGCALPMINGILGTVAGHLVGLEPGGSAVLGAMAGSASFIAAPAAVRIALPQASPGIYLTLSLGITLPFTLAVGIPVYLMVATRLP